MEWMNGVNGHSEWTEWIGRMDLTGWISWNPEHRKILGFIDICTNECAFKNLICKTYFSFLSTFRKSFP